MERILISNVDAIGFSVTNHIVPLLRYFRFCCDIHQTVLRITVESIILNPCRALPSDGHQIRIGIEGKRLDCGYSATHADCAQVVAVTESIEANRFHFVGDYDVFDFRASVECILSDSLQAASESDVFPCDLLVVGSESICSDGAQTVREYQLLDISGVVEGVVCNGIHSFGKGYVCQ